MFYNNINRLNKQKIYGYYCLLCKKLNINILPYHQFKITDYENIRVN